MMRDAHVIVYPSIRELEVSVVEAMAYGLCFLLVEYGRLVELINESHGVKIALSPKPALALKLRE